MVALRQVAAAATETVTAGQRRDSRTGRIQTSQSNNWKREYRKNRGARGCNLKVEMERQRAFFLCPKGLDGSVVENPAVQEPQETWLQSLGQEDPLEEDTATHSMSLILPGESHGQRNLAAYSLQGCKESDTTEATQHACRGQDRYVFHLYFYLLWSHVPLNIHGSIC